MLTHNQVNEPFRILAIDPGTDTLGISILDVDVISSTITLVHAFTFQASRHIDDLLPHDQWRYQDIKYLRLQRHMEHLYGLMLHYQPHYLVHESAFMGKFPKAFQGLTECLYAIRQARDLYSPYLPFEGITPMQVKHFVGGVKKEEVLNALSKKTDIQNLFPLLNSLDEHAIDSIAIGYTKAHQILNDYQNYFMVHYY